MSARCVVCSPMLSAPVRPRYAELPGARAVADAGGDALRGGGASLGGAVRGALCGNQSALGCANRGAREHRATRDSRTCCRAIMGLASPRTSLASLGRSLASPLSHRARAASTAPFMPRSTCVTLSTTTKGRTTTSKWSSSLSATLAWSALSLHDPARSSLNKIKAPQRPIPIRWHAVNPGP